MAQPAFIQTIVTSTRIRLARNLAAYPFPQKLNRKLAEEVVYLVEQTLGQLDNFQKNDIATLSEEESILLQEQHLISPALIRRKGISAAFISPDKSISVMVNEEDHLRQQCIHKGFDLYKAYETISGIDEGLGGTLGFAYDKKLGYLTACPSNLGTGMRASVMMFLPGLAWSKELEKFIPQLKAGGLTVRGVFGEGTAAEGYTYQVSNERTLGLSEEEILDQMVRMTMTLCDLELRARERMLEQNELSLKDACMRAYGTLTNCVLLPQKELMTEIVKVKLGVALGFFRARNMRDLNDFIADMRPASFRLENSLQSANETECDLIRAEIVHKVLPELVLKANG
ncbi:MAG: ATP--guanido phosphotransferase [Clostridia bacterium]|nr:ATP--guanido phosphotransferase [Clostridia bacterium]